MWESFALQCICNIAIWNFNESLTNDFVNFEQLAPGDSTWLSNNLW